MSIIFYIICFARKVYQSVYKSYYRWFTLALCQYHGAVFGSKPAFNGKVRIIICRGGKLTVGNAFICNSSPLFSIDNLSCSKIFIESKAELAIGDYCGISNTAIYCTDSIRIGNHVNIGAGCLIMDSDFHSLNINQRKDRATDTLHAKKVPIVIDDNVFIGARCTITKGVTIGNGAVIATGSVVTKDIPPLQLWGGVPARFIKLLDQE